MTSDYDFKVGDLVQLKSGGPRMSVGQDGYARSEIRCIWFDVAHASHAANFPGKVLVKVESQETLDRIKPPF